MNTRWGLVWFAVLTTACSSVDALEKACIPGVDCDAINTIEPPSNCSVCTTCQDNWGSCSPGGSACKRGSVDLDPHAPGCESLTSDVQARWSMDPTSDSVSSFKFNGNQVQIPITVSALAYDEDDPSCIPTFTQSCAYTIRTLELEISDFSIRESSWSSGVATLNGPLAATDDATGVAVNAPMLFAFDVRQGSKRRVALSSALATVGIIRNDPHHASFILEVALVDFGGYQISDIFMQGELFSD